jgi:hypothetical protein
MYTHIHTNTECFGNNKTSDMTKVPMICSKIYIIMRTLHSYVQMILLQFKCKLNSPIYTTFIMSLCVRMYVCRYIGSNMRFVCTASYSSAKIPSRPMIFFHHHHHHRHRHHCVYATTYTLHSSSFSSIRYIERDIYLQYLLSFMCEFNGWQNLQQKGKNTHKLCALPLPCSSSNWNDTTTTTIIYNK